MGNMPSKSPHSHTENKPHSKFANASFIIAAGLFVSSLFFPVFLAQTHDINGYWVLLMGWMGFIAFQFAWYAAPLALLAIHLSRKSPQMGFFLSIVAILIASEAFLFSKVPLQESQHILGYGNGFYIWYASFYIVALGLLQNLIQSGNHNVTHNNDSALSSSIDLPESYTPPLKQRAKATKKIVINKEPAHLRRPSINRNNGNIWKAKNPPSPPQKSISNGGNNIVLPPKLPTRKKSVTPPPIPKTPFVFKTKPMPPPLPLPAKREKKLKLPPFFSR